MKVLSFGGWGQLGSDLAIVAGERGHDLVRPRHSEVDIRNACADFMVVRGSGLFGHAGSAGKGGNLVETMLSKAEAGEPIQVVDDQFAAPTCTRDMAERIFLWLESRVPSGVYHGANRGGTAWS